VEFALALPILALLLIAVVDMGRAFNNYITITNAAREGARFGSRIAHTDPSGGGTDPDDLVKSAVIQEAANSGVSLTYDNVSIQPEGYGTDRDSGEPLTVTVEYTFTTFIGGLIGLPEFTMRTETSMRIFGDIYKDPVP
jgi:Flp pilus assembly protein TadG